MTNADDIYIMATQQVSDSKISQTDVKGGNTLEDDLYNIPTQQITKHSRKVPLTSGTNDNHIYELATQQLSEPNNAPETEKDDIYMLATQPMNTDSQFKVPKSYTFKKKSAAVLEESLTSLLGVTNKEDDIFDAATQKLTEPVNYQKSLNDIAKADNAFELPTQVIPESFEDRCGKDLDVIFLQPTQNLQTETGSVSIPRLEEMKHDKIEGQ